MNDVIIIGGGPAGLTAAIYTCRFNLKTTIVENNSIGGQLSKIHKIDNYPGTPEIDGASLSDTLFKQAASFGTELIINEVKKIIDGDIKKVVLADDTILETKTIIIASGTSITRLNLEHAKEFTGKGISYCATCDGFFYRKKDVAVLGQRSEAIKEALFLSSIANKVYIIGQRDSLLAEETVLKNIEQAPNIEIIYQDSAKELIIEDEKIAGLLLNSGRKIDCVGIFPYMGTIPNTNFLDSNLLDENGFVIVNDKMETKLKGIYGAGDVINKEFRQVVTACNDGAIAANSINLYLKKK